MIFRNLFFDNINFCTLELQYISLLLLIKIDRRTRHKYFESFLHFINVYSNEIFIFSNKFSLLNIHVLNICAALYLYNVNSNDLLLRKINLFRFILTQDIHCGILFTGLSFSIRY